jgi:hypothetical protein
MTTVPIAELLRVNADRWHFVNARVCDRRKCQEYADRWLAGERWEPVTLQADMVIIDGNHRVVAAHLLAHENITAEVRP